MNKIKIIKAGFHTTVQDRGRLGYQKFGMPVAGAMDDFSLRASNIILGKNEYAAVLEATLLGPSIEFLCDEIISITGANMSPKLNGRPILMWTSILVKKGDILSLSGAKNGLRSYLAFSREIDLPEVNNSKSTYSKSGIGGYKGRKLLYGDILDLEDEKLSNQGSYIGPDFLPSFEKEANIRVVMGPQDDFFPDSSIETFLNNPYKISVEADRMGYRLEGPLIEHIDTPDIISDGIVFGSIQVPGQGQPIILMADRQTAGGYTKIATVISSDLPKLAQMGPGSSLHFEKVEIDQAHEIYKKYEENIEKIKDFVLNNKFDFRDVKKLNLKINKQVFNVEYREMWKTKLKSSLILAWFFSFKQIASY